jgi:hypothetical protein
MQFNNDELSELIKSNKFTKKEGKSSFYEKRIYYPLLNENFYFNKFLF